MPDTLGNKPVLGLGGTLGGFWGSIVATTPVLQFLSALFGVIIGLATLGSMTYKFYKWRKGDA